MVLMALPLLAVAQFYVTGDDPGRLKWYSMDTPDFRIIYPEGNDSLARVYGKKLERYRVDISRTSGYLPGGPERKRMPVVLHTWNSSNGSVAWAPKRMDLFAIPSAYDPEPLPWDSMLSVHELRHVSQMQFGMTNAMKPFNWFFGEMFNILVSVVYPGISTMEGDAVVTETAYTRSGRGRTADFLNYYRVAADEGLKRDWVQWRFDSQKNYSPTYYALGYMTVGGIRHFYNCPDYMARSYDLISRRPYRFGGFRAIAKEAAGKKRFNEVFCEIADTMAVIWKAEADARAPFIKMEEVSAEPRLYTDYTSNIFVGNDLYAIKRGHLNTSSLVRIQTDSAKAGGKDEKVSSFASQAGKLRFHGNRIYWSETHSDERWSMKAVSKIHYMQGTIQNGRPVWSGHKSLSDGKKLLYNPSPSEDGKKVSCVEYHVSGGSSLVVADSEDGNILLSIKAPDGLQLVETAWIGEKVYVTGISEGGYGIYTIDENKAGLKMVLRPEPVMIKDFRSYGKELMFTCDRSGANELYHFDPHDGRLIQKTSIRHGGESFAYSPDGKWLYFSSQTVKGKRIYRTPVDELLCREADWAEKHEYMLAEALAAQERVAAAAERTVCPEEGCETRDEAELSFSEPKRYRKFPNAFNVHSWAPVYVNVDNIMNMSFDKVYEAASLGATGIIQNRLSTATGEFGYSAHKDPYDPLKWRHSGHARFTYSGFYPVIEASVDFNDRSALQYIVKGTLADDGNYISLSSRLLESPSLSARFRTYIPFSFTSGGWYSGIIPQLSYSISNDFFNTAMPVISQREEDGGAALGGTFISATEGKNRVMQYLSGSLRAYTSLGTSNSCVYPRWGIGTEIGGWANLNASQYFSPMGYVYLYGYVPGFLRSHGLKLSATMQFKLSDSPFGQTVTNVAPRGFTGSAAMMSNISTMKQAVLKVSADYGIPVYIGDISIMNSFLYLKRLVLTPHFDYMFMDPLSRRQSTEPREGLWSAGATLAFNLESFLWLEWPCTIGVTASLNGGPSFAPYREIYGARPYYVGPTFNVTF